MTINMSTSVPRIATHTSRIALALAVGMATAAAPSFADTLTVCADGSCDFDDIQAAIDASADGDVIEIAAGTYAPSATLNTLGKAIELHGATGRDGTPATMITGLSNKRVIQCVTGEGPGTVLENLVITAGSAGYGAGCYCDGTSPTIANCIFSGNMVSASFGSGGGLCLFNSNAVVTNCLFTENDARYGAGLKIVGLAPTISHCTMSQNSGTYGVGIDLSYTFARVEECTVTANVGYQGGGVRCVSGHPTLTQCTIHENVAYSSGEGGGVYIEDGEATLVGCSITANEAFTGGGVHLSNSDATIDSCVVSSNIAPTGGGVSASGAALTLTGCIISDNEASYHGGGLYFQVTSSTIDGCIVSGNVAGDHGGGGELSYSGGVSVITGSTFCGNTAPFGPQVLSTTWIDGGGNCWTQSCNDADGDGQPDSCTSVGDGLHRVPEDFKTIEEAMDVAGDGDTVEIAAGTYLLSEPLNSYGRTLTVRGAIDAAGLPATILDGQGLHRLVESSCGEGLDTVFENLVITNGWGANGGGVAFFGASPVLRNCAIRECSAAYWGGGIEISYGAPVLIQCDVSHNESGEDGGGISVYGATVAMSGCTISQNLAGGVGGGLSLSREDSHVTIDGTVFCGNQATTGMHIGLVDASWPELGEVCFSLSCQDSDGDGWPNECGAVGDGIHLVPDEFATVEEAVTVAGEGDMVVLAAGTYLLAETINPSGKAITIRGAVDSEGRSASIIDAQHLRRAVQCETQEGPTTRFENLTFTNGSASHGAGAWIDQSSPAFVNCTFAACVASEDGGGAYLNSSAATFERCLFTANVADRYGGGLFASGGQPSLVDCTVTRNVCEFGGGLYLTEGDASLAACEISFNEASVGGGLNIPSGTCAISECWVSMNAATSSGGGMRMSGAEVSMSNTVFCANTAPTSWHLAYTTFPWSDGGGNCFATTCDDSDGDGHLDECGSVGDGVHHVPSEYPTIEAAMAAAGYGDVIQIAAGTYTPVATLNPANKTLTLRGAVDETGSPTTIIDGQGLRRVLQCSFGEGPQTRFENLVLTNGVASGGGGLYLWGASPAIVNCRIVGNRSVANSLVGGGIYAAYSQATLIDCTVTDNIVGNYGWGGGLWAKYCNLTLLDCTFSANSAGERGGGLYLLRSASVVVGCTISGNSAAVRGGGIYIEDSEEDLIIGCSVTGNAATGVGSGGGLTIDGGECAIEGCTIAGNTAGNFAGGVSIIAGSPRLTSCTISDNISNNQGGGLYCSLATPVISDCLFSGNAAATVGGGLHVNLGEAAIQHCTVTGNTANLGGAGLHFDGSASTVGSTTVTGNAALFGGGGVFIHESPVVLASCTVSENSSLYYGGGLYIDSTSATPSIVNSLLCGNTAPTSTQLHLIGTSTWTDAGGNCVNDRCDGCAIPAAGDYDGNGVIDGEDLSILLGVWGHLDQADYDLTGDGIVDGLDLSVLLGNW